MMDEWMFHDLKMDELRREEVRANLIAAAEKTIRNRNLAPRLLAWLGRSLARAGMALERRYGERGHISERLELQT